MNDTDIEARRAFVRQTLISHVVGMERASLTLRLHLAPTAELRSLLEHFIALERQCCAYLTFTVLPLDSQRTAETLEIAGPPEAAATLQMFAMAADEMLKKGRQCENR